MDGSQERAKRSRFNEALAVLAGHGMPIFDMMRETGQALPMQVGIWRKLRKFCKEQRAAGNPTIHGVPAGHALRKLSRSRRYLRALAAEGAMRHDLEGNPRVPVAEEHRQYAAAKLEEARLRAEARRAA